MDNFRCGDKVMYIPERKIYEFGYISQPGRAVIYVQGKRNMQDSIAVDIKDLVRIED